MRLWILIFGLLGAWIAASGDAHARAAYKSPERMIASAEVIAVVDVTAVEKTTQKGHSWTYSQQATAKVEATIKGQLPNQVALYGGEDFICAQVRFETGRHLVFLDRDGELWTGNNWQLSVIPIENEQVAWSKTASQITKRLPLAETVEHIRSIVTEQQKAPRYTLEQPLNEKEVRWVLTDEKQEKLSAATLEFVSNLFYRLPLGSKVEYFHSCVRGPDYPTPQQWQQLEATARSIGIVFVQHPSG